MRAMLIDSNVSKKFWGEAVLTAAYLLNRSPSSTVAVDKTPYELWLKKQPDLSNIKCFGSTAYMKIIKPQKN